MTLSLYVSSLPIFVFLLPFMKDVRTLVQYIGTHTVVTVLRYNHSYCTSIIFQSQQICPPSQSTWLHWQRITCSNCIKPSIETWWIGKCAWIAFLPLSRILVWNFRYLIKDIKSGFYVRRRRGKKRLIILAALFHPNFRIRFLSSVCSLEAAGRGKKLSGFLITGLPFCKGARAYSLQMTAGQLQGRRLTHCSAAFSKGARAYSLQGCILVEWGFTHYKLHFSKTVRD